MNGKATKKPFEINWFKYKDENLEELDDWVESFNDSLRLNFEINKVNMDGSIDTFLKVKTLEGTSYTVPNGYYIIRGVEGEYYLCEPKIFEKTYNIN